jgi:hypothetical protein
LGNSEKDLLAIAVVVRIGRDCLRNTGLRLELGLGLGTERYLVLWNRRLRWCRILAWRSLGGCFILSCGQTLHWIRNHQYLPFMAVIGRPKGNFTQSFHGLCAGASKVVQE